MTDTIIDCLYRDNKLLLDYLEKNKEISLKNIADNNLKKSLIVASASYFEDRIKDVLITLVENKSGGDDRVSSFLKNKGIERQYHTYFNWKDNNANSFFSLFGSDFSREVKEDIKKSQELDESIKAFLEMELARNSLVHTNFASYPIDKTPEDCYQLYTKASKFIDYLTEKLRP